jgi:hypothetical protein
MNLSNRVFLSLDDIKDISSHYLNEGKKQESWQIDSVEVIGKRLTAQVSMPSIYLSKTNNDTFHLSILTTMEFVSQLLIIYLHVWAGLTQKKREGWMIESSTRSIHAIRDPKHIQVEMSVLKIKKHGENIYCIAEFQVTDRQGGLSEVKIKGILS